MPQQNPAPGGAPLTPQPVRPGMSISDLIRQTYLARNAACLREASRLLTDQMLTETGTLGLSICGPLSLAGLGLSCLAPLLRGGYVDWMVSTGANLYHDAYLSLNLPVYRGAPRPGSPVAPEETGVRVGDVILPREALLSADRFYGETVTSAAFQRSMSSAEFHHLTGRLVKEKETALGVAESGILSAAYECGVPVYSSSPVDSAIGRAIAAAALAGNRLTIDPNLDVNEAAAIAHHAKQKGRSGVWILGEGSPRDFLMQIEPHLRQILGLGPLQSGFDNTLQVTDPLPETGGFLGASPPEAPSGSEVAPGNRPGTVVVHCDPTIALPLLTTYVLENVPPRPLKRLYDLREELLETLRDTHLQGRVSSMLPDAIRPIGRKEPSSEGGSRDRD